jgi:hypothetical protein
MSKQIGEKIEIDEKNEKDEFKKLIKNVMLSLQPGFDNVQVLFNDS